MAKKAKLTVPLVSDLLITLMTDALGVEPEQLTMNALLNQDFDADQDVLLDIVHRLNTTFTFGQPIDPERTLFPETITYGHVLEHVCRRVNLSNPYATNPCNGADFHLRQIHPHLEGFRGQGYELLDPRLDYSELVPLGARLPEGPEDGLAYAARVAIIHQPGNADFPYMYRITTPNHDLVLEPKFTRFQASRSEGVNKCRVLLQDFAQDMGRVCKPTV